MIVFGYLQNIPKLSCKDRKSPLFRFIKVPSGNVNSSNELKFHVPKSPLV